MFRRAAAVGFPTALISCANPLNIRESRIWRRAMLDPYLGNPSAWKGTLPLDDTCGEVSADQKSHRARRLAARYRRESLRECIDDGDTGVDFDGLTIEDGRTVTPLADGSERRLDEKGVTRNHFDGLNGAVHRDDSVEFDATFAMKLLGEGWIFRLNATNEHRGLNRFTDFAAKSLRGGSVFIHRRGIAAWTSWRPAAGDTITRRKSRDARTKIYGIAGILRRTRVVSHDPLGNVGRQEVVACRDTIAPRMGSTPGMIRASGRGVGDGWVEEHARNDVFAFTE